MLKKRTRPGMTVFFHEWILIKVDLKISSIDSASNIQSNAWEFFTNTGKNKIVFGPDDHPESNFTNASSFLL